MPPSARTNLHPPQAAPTPPVYSPPAVSAACPTRSIRTNSRLRTTNPIADPPPSSHETPFVPSPSAAIRHSSPEASASAAANMAEAQISPFHHHPVSKLAHATAYSALEPPSGVARNTASTPGFPPRTQSRPSPPSSE